MHTETQVFMAGAGEEECLQVQCEGTWPPAVPLHRQPYVPFFDDPQDTSPAAVVSSSAQCSLTPKVLYVRSYFKSLPLAKMQDYRAVISTSGKYVTG